MGLRKMAMPRDKGYVTVVRTRVQLGEHVDCGQTRSDDEYFVTKDIVRNVPRIGDVIRMIAQGRRHEALRGFGVAYRENDAACSHARAMPFYDETVRAGSERPDRLPDTLHATVACRRIEQVAQILRVSQTRNEVVGIGVSEPLRKMRGPVGKGAHFTRGDIEQMPRRLRRIGDAAREPVAFKKHGTHAGIVCEMNRQHRAAKARADDRDVEARRCHQKSIVRYE